MAELVRDLNVSRRATAYESITVSDQVRQLTAASVAAANRALVTVENAPLRFRVDGTDPSSSQGHLLNDGDTLTLEDRWNIERFRAIRSSGSDAAIRVTYYV